MAWMLENCWTGKGKGKGEEKGGGGGGRGEEGKFRESWGGARSPGTPRLPSLLSLPGKGASVAYKARALAGDVQLPDRGNGPAHT